MTGQYEADSLLLGWRAAYALAEQNTTLREGGSPMGDTFDAHSRYEHYDP